MLAYTLQPYLIFRLSYIDIIFLLHLDYILSNSRLSYIIYIVYILLYIYIYILLDYSYIV